MSDLDQPALPPAGIRALRVLEYLHDAPSRSPLQETTIAEVELEMGRADTQAALRYLADWKLIFGKMAGSGYEGAILTDAGAKLVENLRAERASRVARANCMRDVVLQWIYDCGDGSTPTMSGFLESPYNQFHGDEFTKIELRNTLDWLHNEGLIEGIRSFQGGVVRASLTNSGRKLIESGIGANGTSLPDQQISPLSRPSDKKEGSMATSTPPPSGAHDGKTVFLVHGQDTRPYKTLETFLHFVGLKVMSWSQAASLTGKTQPHTYDIVRAGITTAAAVIIIFSPDEDARLSSRLTPPGKLDESFAGQPRQNVLLEAGMAFAIAPERTIFVRSEDVRDISDISGFNYVKLDGKWDSRNDLLKRLQRAGAAASPSEEDLCHRLAGEFKVDPA